jgi:hypothetical protein
MPTGSSPTWPTRSVLIAPPLSCKKLMPSGQVCRQTCRPLLKCQASSTPPRF